MENKCVSCGAVIPEGRQVCPNCESVGAKIQRYCFEESCALCACKKYAFPDCVDRLAKLKEEENKMPKCMECKWWDICHGTRQVGVDCFEKVDSPKEVVSLMISKFGEDSQIDVAIEEMSELIKELVKYKRSKIHSREKQAASREHVIEEVGDVMFMFEYIKLIFNVSEDEIQKIIEEKAKRTKERYIDVEE